jgi:monovalent cation:H+ antiporter, CPA1 family
VIAVVNGFECRSVTLADPSHKPPGVVHLAPFRFIEISDLETTNAQGRCPDCRYRKRTAAGASKSANVPITVASGGLVLAVILAGVIVARVLERAGLPLMIAIALAGIVGGALVPASAQISIGPYALAVFLPALIFEAAWDADAPTLRRAARAIAVLALPGVLLTAALAAGAAVLSGALDWAAALVLGAVISATDPVSVLATFRKLGLPHLLVMIVEGESVANDGVALALVQSFIPLAIAGIPHLGVAETIVQMLVVSGGGIICGVVVAIPIGLTMRRRFPAFSRVALTIVVAYGSYALASALGTSGIFASAAGGITLRAMVPLRSSDPDAVAIDRTWDGIALVVNAVVFALVGLTLRLERIVQEPLLLLLVLAAVAFSRVILAYWLVPLRGLTDDVRGWRHSIALAGLRGGLSLAIVVGLPAGLTQRDAIRDATFAVVFATLIVQGALLGPLLTRLRRGSGQDATFAGGAG